MHLYVGLHSIFIPCPPVPLITTRFLIFLLLLNGFKENPNHRFPAGCHVTVFQDGELQVTRQSQAMQISFSFFLSFCLFDGI